VLICREDCSIRPRARKYLQRTKLKSAVEI